MYKNALLRYLENRREALGKREELVLTHKMLCEAAPDFYRHLLTDPLADASQKREVLINLLGTPMERQRLLEMLQQLPVEEALAILNGIRDLRINRSRARELVLECLLGHEHLPTLAASRRQRVAHLFRHVLGERTWASMKRFLAHETPEGELFLRREVLRYAWQGDTARLRETLCFLTGVPFTVTQPDLAKALAARRDISQGRGLPAQTLFGLRGIYHPKISARQVRQVAAPNVQYAHVDGALTTAYREELAAGAMVVSPPEVGAMLAGERDGFLPTLDGRVAVVLDLSLSMASSGERLYHPAALALALVRLLQTSLKNMRLYQVGGGSENLEVSTSFQTQGDADIAQALLRAVQDGAQIVLLLTDGYENQRQGDTAQVARGLRLLEYHLPIYQVVPVYALAENLLLRRLSEEIPLLPIAHEEQARELLAYVLLAMAGEQLADEELHQLQTLLTVR